jgi:hypothetical protein
MNDMPRTIVLLITHLAMLGAGAGLALATVRSRRQALVAHKVALDTHEMFLNGRADQLRRGAFLAELPPVGRHRRADPSTKAGRLVRSNLDEAVAILATDRAKREQERRAFVDIMTNIAQAKRWHQGAARVA